MSYTVNPIRWTLWEVPAKRVASMLPRVTDAVARVFSNNIRHAVWRPNWTRGDASDGSTLDGFLKQLTDYGHKLILVSAPSIATEPLEDRQICGFIVGGRMGEQEWAEKAWMHSRGVEVGMGSLRYIGVEDCCRDIRFTCDLSRVTSLLIPIEFDEADDERTPAGIKPRKLSSLLHEAWCRGPVADCPKLWMGTQESLKEMWEWGQRLGYRRLPGPPLLKPHCGIIQRLVMFAADNQFARNGS